MDEHRVDVAIVGAGIAGAAAAYYLTKNRALNVVVIDKLQPLSLTTACSGENFRNFWPQQCMSDFTSRSFVLMQELIREHGNVFSLKQTGYEFISKRNETMFGEVDGSITASFAADRDYLAEDVAQITKVHEAGAIDVYGLGSLLIKLAKQQGANFLQATVKQLDQVNDGYVVKMDSEAIRANRVVVAAGPFVNEVLQGLDVSLPLESICQSKFVIPDPLGVIPRDMPFTICADEITLAWNDEELQALQEDQDLAWLTESFPAGLHIKPEGADRIKMGWAYNRLPESPSWQCASSDVFPDVVMRGASQYVPGLLPYVASMPTPITTFAGYYTRTKDNLPLICPVNSDDLFVIGGLSGYGTMSACAAGDLCASYMQDESLPDYAKYFHLNRYDDPNMVTWLESNSSDGQL